MSVVNNLKSQVDLPVWEWCRFAPVVSAAGLCTCSDESSGGRYIYYLSSATQFWRYDTITDGWQLLTSPTTGAVTIASMRYTTYGGFRANVISAGATSIVIPGLQGNKLVGKTIRITSGTGAGQERTITAITHEICDHGIATTASALLLTDSQTIPKKWGYNQWQGHQVRVVFGTGQSQVKNVLYNDQNTLYFSTPNWQPYDSWNNTGFSAAPPYALPVSAVSHYYIEKSTATVAAWTTTPDSTSKFVIMSGGIWLGVGTTVALGGAYFHYYDILSDSWDDKTRPSGVMTTLMTSDFSLERTGEISGAFDSGDCDASAARTMVDATKTWTVDRYANYQVRVTRTSTGVVQRRRILGNTANTLYVNKPWDETPDTNHTWAVYGDTNAIWMAGNAQSSLYKYLVEEDLWTPGQEYDAGVVSNLCYYKTGQLAFNATTTVNTAAILSVDATPTVAGTGYKVGDVLNVTQAAGGKVRVTSITPATGAVTGIELFACGTGTYTTGTGKATSVFWPAAGGVNCTISILTVGSVARATTTVPHNFIVGDVVNLRGSDVGAWNTAFTITTVDGSSVFEFIPPNNVAPVNVTNPNSATVITDPSKSWTADEHIGKMVTLTIAGLIPTVQVRKITDNTANSLTVVTLTAQGVIGTSRYVIHDLNYFGRDNQYKIPAQGADGWATAGSSATSLEDTTKTWIPGQWVGYKFKVICGTGYDKGEIAITANTATTLTMSGFTPDITTKYRIMDSYGLVTTGASATTFTDTTKSWAVNQWVGKSLRFNLATANAYYEVLITGNTINTITYATTTVLNDTNTCYTILEPAVRQIGIQAMWNYGRSDTTQSGKYLWVSRGGSTVAIGTNLIDRYDITQDSWNITRLLNPQAELEVLGCQWAYDGGDYIYWANSGAVGTRVFRINLDTQVVEPAGQHPYANGVGVAGNRMEIITTIDGLKYLYLMRATGSEWWRTLLFW